MGIDGYISYGTSGATAMVSGAVTDYLSRGYVREHLNLAQNEGVALPPGGLKVFRCDEDERLSGMEEGKGKGRCVSAMGL